MNSTVAEQLNAGQPSTSVEIYDSLGARHTLYVAFNQVDRGEPYWLLRLFIDRKEIGGTPGEAFDIVQFLFRLTNDGSSTDVDRHSIGNSEFVWANGASSARFTWQYSLSQSAEEASIVVTQDGSPGACTQRGYLDYDGDGVDDLVIWRPSLGLWAILLSSTNYTQSLYKQWGLPGDHPMEGDYGSDGKTDLVVWRPSNGTWYICASERAYNCSQGLARQFGLPGDRPIRP